MHMVHKNSFGWATCVPPTTPVWEREAKGHFTHKPRAMTIKVWEPKRKRPKVVPTHLQNHVVWSRILECSVSCMWSGPQPNATSMNFYPCGSSHMIKQNKSTFVSIRSAMVSQLSVRPTSMRWLFENNPSDHEHMIHLMPIRNPRRLYIHLALTYYVGPSP